MSSQRLGPLRNGNQRGDPHAAPRCGAQTRAGCPCRQPAMPNGRCRLHGGRSSGPRTEAGRAAIANAHTRHGLYGAESRAFLAAIDTLLRGAPIPPPASARTKPIGANPKTHPRNPPASTNPARYPNGDNA